MALLLILDKEKKQKHFEWWKVFFIFRYFFPRQMLTHHFWSEVQRKEFMQHFHKQKVSHFPIVLDHMYKQITRHTYGTAKENFLHIIKKVLVHYWSFIIIYPFILSRLFYDNSLDWSFSNKGVFVCCFFCGDCFSRQEWQRDNFSGVETALAGRSGIEIIFPVSALSLLLASTMLSLCLTWFLKHQCFYANETSYTHLPWWTCSTAIGHYWHCSTFHI